jgi:hypothetical protein
MYKIKKYSYLKAKALGVQIKPSSTTGKKIDVFYKGKKIASIGQRGYMDFPTYIEKYGLQYALKRRKLYHARHTYNKRKNTAGYFAAKILW